MSLHIRSATLDDLHLVAPLFDAYRQFYEQAPDLSAATSFIQSRMVSNESVILLAQDGIDAGAQTVGFCQLYPSFCSVEAAPIYVLYDLFVSPLARQNGVGRALLRTAAALAHERGMARMDLTTARTNLKAQALYESEGWTQDRVFLAYNLRLKGNM